MVEVYRINYKGFKNGEVFEKTKEDIDIILGKSEVVSGVEEALKKMREGETKKISLKAKDAYGERKGDLVAIVSINEFKKRKIRPAPGLVVDINNRYGVIRTISGGRVVVDFNHPLAGRDVSFEVRLVKRLEGKEKLEAIAKKVSDGLAYLMKKEKGLSYEIKKNKIFIREKLSQNLEKIVKRLFEDIDKEIKIEFFKERKKSKRKNKDVGKGVKKQER